MICESPFSLIGHTPLIPCKTLSTPEHTIYVKCEGQNPTGTIKDRIIGPLLKHSHFKNQTLLVADWGPFALSAAWACQRVGAHCQCYMPMDTPKDFLIKIQKLKADIFLKDEPLRNLRQAAAQTAKQDPQSFYFLDPWSDAENPMAYAESLAEELWEETKGNIAAIISPVETCGCLMGCATGLKIHAPQISAVGAFIDNTNLYSTVDPYGQQDPDLFVPQLTDSIISCTFSEAKNQQEKLWSDEGILCGVAGGAALYAASKIDSALEGNLVVLLPSCYHFY